MALVRTRTTGGTRSHIWRRKAIECTRCACSGTVGPRKRVKKSIVWNIGANKCLISCERLRKQRRQIKRSSLGIPSGALAALYAASKGAPERTKGLCLVNSAGNFEPNAAPGPEKKTMAQKAVGTAQDMEEAEENNTLQGKLRVAFGKLAAYGIFYFTKIRIKTILNQVYDNDVDEDLVRSIAMAAEDPEARETFYAISLAGSRTQVKPRDLLENLNAPLMLLWGENDPWMTPTKAERIMEIKPSATYSPVPAGHCPQDDNPADSNIAFVEWVETVA